MTTATTRRQGRASRAAAQAAAGQPQAQPDQAEPQPQAEPETPAEPVQPQATVDLGRYPYWMHKPRVLGADGQVLAECGHRDGHTKESDAWTCARKVAREAGLDDGGMYPAS